MENDSLTSMSMMQFAKTVFDSPNVVCECGCKVFTQAFVLKKISAIMSPTSKEEISEIPIYICSKCGKVPQYYVDKPNYSKIFGEISDEK